jgi:hypothetical protein
MGKGFYGCTKAELATHATGAIEENTSEAGVLIRQTGPA